jgi:hypothetical protein
MGEMGNMIKETDKKAQEAQELVKQQSAVACLTWTLIPHLP